MKKELFTNGIINPSLSLSEMHNNFADYQIERAAKLLRKTIFDRFKPECQLPTDDEIKKHTVQCSAQLWTLNEKLERESRDKKHEIQFEKGKDLFFKIEDTDLPKKPYISMEPHQALGFLEKQRIHNRLDPKRIQVVINDILDLNIRADWGINHQNTRQEILTCVVQDNLWAITFSNSGKPHFEFARLYEDKLRAIMQYAAPSSITCSEEDKEWSLVMRWD